MAADDQPEYVVTVEVWYRAADDDAAKLRAEAFGLVVATDGVERVEVGRPELCD